MILKITSFFDIFFSVIISDDKGGVSKMDIYVELTYCMNGINDFIIA